MQAPDKDMPREADASPRKDALLSDISHDLRTPINALLGLAQLLDASELNPNQRAQARAILEAGRALKIVLDDILVLQDPGPDTPEETQDCDPTMAARAVTHMMQPVAWERKLSLSMISASRVPHVALDSHSVRQALYKLVDNALKYTPSGRVEVRVEAIHRRDIPFIRFSVTDTGPGIPPELGEKLYTRDSRPTRYTRRRQGSGFGLIIVKQIVDAAGGHCGFDSALGEGATFWFTLPAVQQLDPAEDSNAAHNRAPEGLHLLAYMGDETTHKEISEILVPFGNHVTFARFPADLVALAVRTKFDAAIVRIDFADMLASAPGVNLPILALTPPEKTSVRSAAAGAAQNWPCAAYHIYGALKGMLNHKPTGPERAEAQPVDHAAIAALEKSVGEETLIEIFQTYLDTSLGLRKKIQKASDEGDWAKAESLARDVIGSASGLGLAAITLSARDLCAEIRDKSDETAMRRQARRLIQEGSRTRRTLLGLYPELKG